MDSTLVNRLRNSAIYEVCAEGLDRACFAWLAGEGFSSMRATLLAQIAAITSRLQLSTRLRSSRQTLTQPS